MDIGEIQVAVQAFESKLKPVTAEEKAMAAGIEIPEAAPAPPPVETEACLIPAFKKVVIALYPQYVGKGDVPDLVKDFIDSIPECKEKK